MVNTWEIEVLALKEPCATASEDGPHSNLLK